MKRTMATIALIAMLVGIIPASGCASTGGPYFQKTRGKQVHMQRDRIYNPGDYRYSDKG